MPKETKPITPYLVASLEVIKQQAFIIETIAHLRGYEVDLLPIAEAMRKAQTKLEAILPTYQESKL